MEKQVKNVKFSYSVKLWDFFSLFTSISIPRFSVWIITVRMSNKVWALDKRLAKKHCESEIMLNEQTTNFGKRHSHSLSDSRPHNVPLWGPSSKYLGRELRRCGCNSRAKSHKILYQMRAAWAWNRSWQHSWHIFRFYWQIEKHINNNSECELTLKWCGEHFQQPKRIVPLLARHKTTNFCGMLLNLAFYYIVVLSHWDLCKTICYQACSLRHKKKWQPQCEPYTALFITNRKILLHEKTVWIVCGLHRHRKLI